MIIKKAEYVISSPDYTDCPKPDRPEYAFIGRSNVGKSSLINMVVDNHKLAKTSGSPGKTQLINHFDIVSLTGNEKEGSHKKEQGLRWYLVDLPGYGYAKVSLNSRRRWSR
jgi:GTP-binding protein